MGKWNSNGQKECDDQQKSISLDANWRWTHRAGETVNCYTDETWDAGACPDGETCAKNCAAGAVDEETWEGTYGVKKNGNGLDLGFVTHGPYSVNVGSRSYVMENDKEYKLFSMLQKEITFDVDLSNMPLEQMRPSISLKWKRLAIWDPPIRLVLPMALVTVMASALATSSG